MGDENEATFRRFFEEHIPFNAFLGMKVDEVGDGRCVLRIPFRPEFIGDKARPALHGGVASTIADTAGGLATWTALGISGGDRVSTVDLRVDYLRPGLLEDIVCEARVIRIGNKVAVTAMEVRQGDGYITAEARGVYNVLRTSRTD